MVLNVKIIKDSFERVKPIADDAVNLLFTNLWNDFPASKEFFASTNMDTQKKAVIHSLVFIVENLENTDKLTAYLKAMGGRHVNYGATGQAHYDMFGSSLLKTLGQAFGSEWTPNLQMEWTNAYSIIASAMLEGAKEVSNVREGRETRGNMTVVEGGATTPGAFSPEASTPAAPKTDISFELPPELKESIARKARDLVQAKIREEFERALQTELKKSA